MGFRSGKLRLLLLLSACALAAGCGQSLGAAAKPAADPGSVQVNSAAASQAVARLNEYRLLASVPPVVQDQRLSLGAQLHANYLALNSISLSQVGLNAHKQNPALPGYTQAGQRAGMNSVIYEGVQPVEAIDNWMQTFYHRLGLMDPNLTHVGFGSQGRYQVLDVGQGRVVGFAALDAIALCPSPGTTSGGNFVREIPHPIPGDDNLGVPITIEFFGQRGHSIHGVQARVSNTLTGQEFPVYVQWPGTPFLPEWDLQQVICIIPRDPLPGGATYQVVIDAVVDGKLETFPWQFSTR